MPRHKSALFASVTIAFMAKQNSKTTNIFYKEHTMLMICSVHLPAWFAVKATLEILISLCNILCCAFLQGRLVLPALYS